MKLFILVLTVSFVFFSAFPSFYTQHTSFCEAEFSTVFHWRCTLFSLSQTSLLFCLVSVFPSSKPRIVGIGKILFVFYLQKPQSGDPEIYSTYAYDRTVLEVHSGGSAPRAVPSPSDPKTPPCEIGTPHPIIGCPHTDVGSFPFPSHRDGVPPLTGAAASPQSTHDWPITTQGERGISMSSWKYSQRRSCRLVGTEGVKVLRSLSLICWERRTAASRSRFILRVPTHFISGSSGLLTRGSPWDLPSFADW